MYHPEPYWNDVAKRISQREGIKIIAGDDEPYYRYKRKKFLKLLNSIDFHNKIVLEIGSGPGGNLFEIIKKEPKELHGIDISDEMIRISRKFLEGKNVTVTKTNGQQIPFPENYFDLSFTSTVLQHNTDEGMLENRINEICRVTNTDIYIFEKIEKTVKGTELCMGRPIEFYSSLFAENGFQLQKSRFLDIQVSYLVSGAIRKVLNHRKRKEGEPMSGISKVLQKLSLPVTSVLDDVFKSKRELAMLHFRKI
jgi:ubiquinone/menaquinone biosynthesis C-methylase UbiE